MTESLVDQIARAMWGNLKKKGGFDGEPDDVQAVFLNDALTALRVVRGATPEMIEAALAEPEGR